MRLRYVYEMICHWPVKFHIVSLTSVEYTYGIRLQLVKLISAIDDCCFVSSKMT